MNSFVKITSVILCVAMLVTLTVLTACTDNTKDDPDVTVTPDDDVRNILSVALATDKEPFSFHQDDKVIGVNVDIMAAFAEDLNMDLELKDVADENIVAGLLAGDYKLAVIDFDINDLETLKQVSISNPIISDRETVFVPLGSPINKLADLTGKMIGVRAGYAAENMAKELFGADNVKSYDSVDDLVAAITNGDVAAAIVDDDTASAVRISNPDLIPLAGYFYDHTYRVCALNANNSIINNVNVQIGTLTKDQLNTYLEKYTKGSSETAADTTAADVTSDAETEAE